MSALFQPLDLGPVSLPNRIVVSPMCQYAAADGCMNDWHLQNLMNLAMTGAGLVMVEASHVERRGRITHGCVGLYSDENEAALKRVLDAARRVAPTGTRFGIQLAHAGRKGSTNKPWHERGASLGVDGDAWQTIAPSALPYSDGWHTPKAFDAHDRERLVAAHVAAAKRVLRAGFDVVELHFAHGYFAAECLSPKSNQRTDEYGGSRENRMRLPLEIARAVAAVIPAHVALGARIGSSDFVDGGWDVDDAIVFATALRDLGLRYVCASTNGAVPSKHATHDGFLVPNAAAIREATKMTVRVPGNIKSAAQAEALVASGKVDLVAIARAFIDDPRWPWHAAATLGGQVSLPPQYERVKGWARS